MPVSNPGTFHEAKRSVGYARQTVRLRVKDSGCGRVPVGGLLSDVVQAPVPVLLFLTSFLIPFSFSVGTFVLSPYRLVLLLFAGPAFFYWAHGKAGKSTIADALMILHGVWMVVSLSTHYGLAKGLESAGIQALEVVGAYFLARKYVRDLDAFRRSTTVVILYVAALAIPCVYESLTGGNLFGRISLTEPRFGLHRAHGPFIHAIHLGVFAASVVAVSWSVLPKVRSRWLCRAGVMLTVACSVSTGALVAAMVQLQLLVWDTVLHAVRKRWRLLLLILVLCYVAIDVFSNRTPMRVAISYLALNPSTGYYRQAIWDYGKLEVLAHPIVGIGFSDWDRPKWMASASVDNFWLLLAMRYGLVGSLSLLGAVLVAVLIVVGYKLDESASEHRATWIFMVTGMTVGAFTVHYWGEVYAYFGFLVGTASAFQPGASSTSPRYQYQISGYPDDRAMRS